MNKLAFILLVFAALVFAVAVGYDVFLFQQRAMKVDQLRDPPRHFQDRLRREAEEKEVIRPLSTARSFAENRYFQALASYENEKEKMAEKKENRKRIADFLQTPAGEYLTRGMALLTEGKKEEARAFLVHGLELHQQMDYMMYVIWLKALLHSYVTAEESRKKLDVQVLKYLEIIRQASYTEDDFKKIVDELIQRIQEGVSSED